MPRRPAHETPFPHASAYRCADPFRGTSDSSPPCRRSRLLLGDSSMKPGRLDLRSSLRAAAALLGLIASLASSTALAGEPDAKTYWDVSEIRAGMKGVGKTVMTGTALEEFEAEVLGVMKGVSPGRDMILCRLKGCKLEHSGIIQGMSGSPIYIDGKLLGAVAFAWEFAKDPIAGVTPFSQMVQYARSSDRQLAAEAIDDGDRHAWLMGEDQVVNGLAGLDSELSRPDPGLCRGTGGDEADRDARRGDRLLAPGPRHPRRTAPPDRPRADGRRRRHRPSSRRKRATSRSRPGSPLSIAMVTGDFDLSGIGTVTHVEGDRVYGFGHPMLGPRLVRVPDDDRLHPHGLSAGQREHEDGLAAQDGGRARHRRLDRRRRPARQEARHAADDGESADGPVLGAADVQGRDRPRAEPARVARDVGPDQRDRHRGRPARRADGAT